MAENDFPQSTTQSIPAAELKITGGKQEKVTHTIPIRHNEEDISEVMMQVRASTLRRCRGQLRILLPVSFPWSETSLAIAGAAFGGIIGAFAGDVTLNSAKGVLFFVLLPMVLTGSAVAYYFTRANPIQQASAVAAAVLADIPDPDK